MAYLYRHIRLDKNIPFYIGIGSDDNYTRAFSKDSRNKFWGFIVAKTDYEVEILIDNIEWEFACEREKEFISLYGRRDLKAGTLVNLTNGGDGSLGVVMSDETRKKFSEAGKGKVFSEETKRKLSAKAKGRKYSDEYKKQMSEVRVGKKFSAERNKQISETLKKLYATGERIPINPSKYLTEEGRKKISLTHKGRKHTEEAKKKMSQAAMGNKRNLGKPLSDETKKKIGDANRGRKHSEETKRKNSESHKGQKHTLEQRKKVSDSLKNQYASGQRVCIWKGKSLSEERKKKISDALKGRKKTKKAHILMQATFFD